MDIIPHSRPLVSQRQIAAVTRTLKAGRLSQGIEVSALERKIADLCGRREAVAVSSGTAALYLALSALGVRSGDRVVVPAYTCQSVLAAASHVGARILCADAGSESVCVDAESVRPLIRRRVKAVVVAHMFGFLADVAAVRALGAPVIEDCAQCMGAKYPNGAPAGSMGDVAVLSFYATKMLPAGEGGACLTDDPRLADTIRALRDCDERDFDPRSFNFKMTDMTAALARAGLTDLNRSIMVRNSLAAQYDAAFGRNSFRISSPTRQAVCFRYLVSAPGRTDRFIKAARAAGIVCRKPVWRPLHRSVGGHCPAADSLQNRLISVPLYPSMTASWAARICARLPSLF